MDQPPQRVFIWLIQEPCEVLRFDVIHIPKQQSLESLTVWLTRIIVHFPLNCVVVRVLRVFEELPSLILHILLPLFNLYVHLYFLTSVWKVFTSFLELSTSLSISLQKLLYSNVWGTLFQYSSLFFNCANALMLNESTCTNHEAKENKH